MSNDEHEYDDEYGYDEDDSGSEDSGPSTPPSTHRVLPVVAGAGYETGLLLANSQNSPKKKPPVVVSVNPILYDAHTQASQLVWDVATLPVEHAYHVPSSSSSFSSSNTSSPSSSASSSPASAASASSTPSGRAASLKGFIKGIHMGKGSKDASNGNNNANHSHTDETATTTTGRKNGNGKLGPSDRSLPATNPGLTSLEIHIPQLPPFWKPIQLRRSSPLASHPSTPSSSSHNMKPFTVGEILDAIHRYLQQPITSKEYKTLPEALQKVIARAYWRRYDSALLRTPGNEEEAEKVRKGGIRRVDALGGCTMFVAFVPAPASAGGETWQVILAAPPASPTPRQRS